MSISFDRGRFAPQTAKSYTMWFGDFERWCEAAGIPSLPTTMATLATYLNARADGWSVSTLRMALAAIKAAHTIRKGEHAPDSAEAKRYALDFEHPAFADAWAIIRRAKGTRQVPKDALKLEDIKAIIPYLDESFRGRRAAAMLLMAYGAALRRSELVALNREDLTISPQGVIIIIRRSKTDQGGQGKALRIPRSNNGVCVVRALEEWIALAGIETGPVFITQERTRCDSRAFADVVKWGVKRIGKDPARFSGHSTRRGFVTDAFEKGAPPESIRDKTRHASMDMLLRYREAAEVFDSPADRAVWGLP